MFAVLVLLSLGLLFSEAYADINNCVVLFWGRGCPHCAQVEAWLASVQGEYNFTLVKYEIYYSDVNRQIFAETALYYGTVPVGVPALVAGDRFFVGFEDSNRTVFSEQYGALIGTTGEIGRAIGEGGECPPTVLSDSPGVEGVCRGAAEVVEGCEAQEESSFRRDWLAGLEQKIMAYYRDEAISPSERHSLGYIVFSALLLGLGDGILNPCTLSVLVFLAVYLISIKARNKLVPCGLSFITAVGLVYGLFLGAMLLVVQQAFLWFAGVARIGLALIAGTFGLLEFREAFIVGKEGGRKLLAIPESFKKRLGRLMKMATPASSFVVGALATLAEIPCAGSFPLVFTTIISELPKATWFPLVVFYILCFTLPLAGLVLAFRVGLSVERVEKVMNENKRFMRIFAGLVLIGFAVWFLMGG